MPLVWLVLTLLAVVVSCMVGFVWGMDTERGKQKPAVMPPVHDPDGLGKRYPMKMPDVEVDRQRWLEACRQNYKGRVDMALKVQSADEFWQSEIKPILLEQVAEDAERWRQR